MQTNTSSSPGETQINKKIISTQTISRCGQVIVSKTTLVEKEPEGALQINQTNSWWLKVVEVCFLKILAELLLTRDISFNIHVEIINEIDVNTTWGVI